MAHGTPDWGSTQGTETTHPVLDVGEAAVRLGSPDRFERLGNVLLIDGFEDGMQRWAATPSGTGAVAAPTPKYSRSGAWSLRLTSGSTAPAYISVVHHEPYPVLGRLGLEWSLLIPGTGSKLTVDLETADGTNVVSSSLVVDWGANIIAYVDNGGSERQLGALVPPAADPTLFHTFKLVLDAAAQAYVRALVDNTSINLGGVAARVAPLAGGAFTNLAFTFVGRVGFNDTLYLDDVILTQNEP